MVPFYGQGMNSGFEDVSALSDILDKHLKSGKIPDNSEIAAALDGMSHIF
jgi:2-polyprenyl-6-methoxyphenol hydroxylase-like FAD-dependent oxidoreductase